MFFILFLMFSNEQKIEETFCTLQHEELWENIWYNLCYGWQNVLPLVEIGLRYPKI
mgnify:CR=1 FL=1